MKILLGVCICTAVVFWTAPAWGVDLNPPPWRGQWSTTSQVWEFNYDPLPGAPPETPREYIDPDGPAPGGMPPLDSTYLIVTPLGDWIEQYEIEGPYGVWPLSGEIFVHVDNHDPPNEFKWVWVQLTWYPQDITGLEPELSAFNPMYDPDYPSKLIDQAQLINGWFVSTYEWRIYPNPEWEEFVISGNIYVDELVVDTWCIPEPATIGLLGLGALAVLRRRRA